MEPLSTLHYALNDYWSVNGDPRIANLPFMRSTQPALFILLSYLIFVLYIGPRLMSTRKAFSLKYPMILYNLTMSLGNAYFFIRSLQLHNYGADIFNTTFPSFTDTSPATQAIIQLHYFYVLSKFIDLLDTVFFVLRKKSRQITGLHVYHHFSVPIQGWTYFRLCSTDCVYVSFGIINSLVHTIMYAYYGLAAFGPQMGPYLWWKRYITQLQIGQFIALLSVAVYFLVTPNDYPLYFKANLFVQSVLYIVLFTRFYLQTYTEKKTTKVV